MQPARSIDSYRIILENILRKFNPNTVFEWGPGKSTEIISSYESVYLIDSVEHDINWYAITKEKLENNDKVRLILEEDRNLYYDTPGRVTGYDLVFVDGRSREKCLDHAINILNEDGVVILHDAERPDYRYAIDMYKYKFWGDNGNTVVLTDSDNAGDKLNEMDCWDGALRSS